ncbi:MAG: HAD family hydrolase [Actinomycetota bacterium]
MNIPARCGRCSSTGGSVCSPGRVTRASAASSRRRSRRTGSGSRSIGGPTPASTPRPTPCAASRNELSVDPSEELRAELIDSYRVVGETAELAVAPGLETCLHALRAAGVRMGIVCDVGLTSSPTLRARLERLGVLDAFDAWSFSDETGVFKPAPEAFRAALDPLGVDPRDAAHIGDNERTDIAGANALGMVSVRYQGLLRVTGLLDGLRFDGLADHVIDDIAALPEVLGIV